MVTEQLTIVGVADRVREAIERGPITQKDLASRIGIAPITLGRKLAAERLFTSEEIGLLAAALEVMPSELMPTGQG